MDPNEMSNLYREHYIDASYQFLVHLAEWISVQKICLEIDQSETRSACDGHVCDRTGTKLAICKEDLT